jgi:hypothetical protein
MFDILPSYLDEKYSPFNNSLPDVIAVFDGIKPMARLSCRQSEDISKFADLAGKRKVYMAEIRRGEISHFYISKSKKLVDYYKSHDPEMKSDPTKLEITDFAGSLGYPKCCIESYLDKSQREIIESYRQDKGIIPPFYFNNLLHSISNYYLSFHMSCSLDCKETKKYNRNIFMAIQKTEPELALRLRKILKLPMIIWHNIGNRYYFDDRIVVLLDGFLNYNVVEYSNCHILKTSYPNNKKLSGKIERDISYFKLGNKIRQSGKKISIYSNKKLVHDINNHPKPEYFLTKFHG